MCGIIIGGFIQCVVMKTIELHHKDQLTYIKELLSNVEIGNEEERIEATKRLVLGKGLGIKPQICRGIYMLEHDDSWRVRRVAAESLAEVIKGQELSEWKQEEIIRALTEMIEKEKEEGNKKEYMKLVVEILRRKKVKIRKELLERLIPIWIGEIGLLEKGEEIEGINEILGYYTGKEGIKTKDKEKLKKWWEREIKGKRDEEK